MTAEEEVVKLLQSYVPPLLVRHILRDSSPIQRPRAERINAAVLFADITNFTALSGNLVDSEVPAAEKLALLLNRFFDRLITIVNEHGGEVTKFAGDALIALWPIPETTIRYGAEAKAALAVAVDRAVNCSMELQNQFPQEPLEGVEVSIEIGIGAGDVYSVYLGGRLNRWEFLLSGSPLVQMSIAINDADPGDVVLSPQAWELVGNHYNGQTGTGGFIKLTSQKVTQPADRSLRKQLPSDAIQAIKPFLPAAILSRVDGGMTEWLSELRWVSVLFILLPGYGASITHPFERTLPEAQRVMVALQEALYRYGGSINKINVDDKGITLVAAFGLPPFSHPDDAARAVHSALFIQSKLAQFKRPNSIGISTGRSYCGPVGNAQRSEYTLIGDDVNLATRLMQLAEANRISSKSSGEIVCDESTFSEIRELAKKGDLLARQLSFSPREMATVKGKESPVVIYRPSMRPWIEIVREPKDHQHGGTLVGRKEEMAQIRELLFEDSSKNIDKKSQLILVEGEAGMGKTFFTGEIIRQAGEANRRILFGSAKRLQQSTDYHPWKPIFEQLYSIDQQDSVEVRKSKVLEKLPYMPGERGYPAMARELSSLLNPVLTVRFPETSKTKELDPVTQNRIRRDFLLRLLQIAAAPRGKQTKAARFIIIEDAQWMDNSSWDFTLDVISNVKPLTVLLTLRPLTTLQRRQLPKSGRNVLNHKDAAWVHLEGFNGEQINELASQSIGVDELAPEFVEFLQEKTGGHPKLCKDLAINLRDKGLLNISTSRATLNAQRFGKNRPLVTVEIHKSVIGRFDQLSAAQQMVLKIAALVEQPFNTDIIENCYPLAVEEGVIGRHMEDLVRLRFLRNNPSDLNNSSYNFDNEIVREEILSLLTNEQKVRV